MFKVKNLSVRINDKEILKDISFSCNQGSIIALLGANGSGKSSFLLTLMGHPLYTITQGFIEYNGQDITTLSPDKRAQLGLFLTFQQPYEIPGVLVNTLLKESFRALHPDESLDVYIDRLSQGAALLKIDRSILDRPLYEGFSGGEKKKLEMLQAYIAHPQILMLDEIDSGLDIDARKLVGATLQELKKLVPDMIIIMVTHHETLFSYVMPDVVAVFARGELKKIGDSQLLSTIRLHGYENG